MKNKFFIIFILLAPLFFWALPSRAATAIDTDKDGLTDEMELKFGTDPNNPDSDGDGFKDLREIDWAYNPLSSSSDRLAQKIEVNLKQQRLTYFIGGVKWREFKVSTGKSSMPTPRGEFKVTNKIKKAWSKEYGLWMPYWMGLVGGVGIHELPIWPSGYREGENHLGTPVSHGCIRLGLKDAPYLFDRISAGISVKIY
jgi:L,D-transpeptidase catalytic domain/Bacterial TSP3 repeat